MLRGYRSVFAAIAGLILLGADNPSQNSTSNASAAQANQKAGQHEEIAVSVSRIGDALEAQNAKTDPNEKERNEREIRDLKAQENSAYWAQAMFWSTISALILSIIGIGLVWTTFRETKAANDIAKADQRPWVDVEVVEVSMSSSIETFDLNASIRITNLGKSPAFNVQSRARIVVSRGSDETVTSDFYPGEEYTRIIHNLLPGGTGEDGLSPKIEAAKIPMTKVYVGEADNLQMVAGPQFVPTLEIMVDYQWGLPPRDAKTIKKFTVSEVTDRWYGTKRIAVPISLGQMPLPQLRSFEHGIAEIT